MNSYGSAINNYGFVRVAAAVPEIFLAQPMKNADNTIKMINEAANKNAHLAVFPELNLTGYTCADLFLQPWLLDAAENALIQVLSNTRGLETIGAVGMPLRIDDQLFNVAVVILSGRIIAVIPKTFLPNYKEFYETRWFAPASRLRSREIKLAGFTVPIGTDIVVETGMPGFTIGVEICEDLWMPIPPSSFSALQDATVIANLSASNGLVGKADYRRELVKNQSGRCVAAYVYSSCGMGESTSDVVFDGHAMIAQNDSMLAESKRFELGNDMIIADIDVDKLKRERMMSGSFGQSVSANGGNYRKVSAGLKLRYYVSADDLKAVIDPHPFVPSDPAKLNERCEEVFQLQTIGLIQRLVYVFKGKEGTVTIGISGGLDSTLVLLVLIRAFDLLGWSRKNIIAVTMPGFGTGDRTLKNAIALCRELGITLREISIVEATLNHLRDIGHESDKKCVVCQNAQARERTKILMDLGFTIGTGDLSEAALGWCTFNGDHMSMYHVNAGVPKTLVQFVVKWVADMNILGDKVSTVLIDIVETPISPELAAATDGEIQKTEDEIGPYELHDFFLFHMIRNGFNPKKIFYLATAAFPEEKYTKAVIKKWLCEFYRRFFFAQFKRNASPDGPKIGSVALSQRGDWRMPSDASGDLWIEETKSIYIE